MGPLQGCSHHPALELICPGRPDSRCQHCTWCIKGEGQAGTASGAMSLHCKIAIPVSGCQQAVHVNQPTYKLMTLPDRAAAWCLSLMLDPINYMLPQDMRCHAKRRDMSHHLIQMVLHGCPGQQHPPPALEPI